MSYLEKLKSLEQTESNPKSTPADVTEGRLIAVKICSHVLNACIWFSFDPDFKPDNDESLAVFYADEIPFISMRIPLKSASDSDPNRPALWSKSARGRSAATLEFLS